MESAFFGDGWYAIECGSEPYRWADVQAELFLDYSGSRSLTLEVAAGRPAGAPTAVIELSGTGWRRRFIAPAEWRTMRVSLPDTIASPSPLRIRTRPAWVPASDGVSSDYRRLGMALRAIRAD
jgi:hypothetical protein